MGFFNDIFHNLALLEFHFLNIIYILLYTDFILSIFFQHSNILTRASHHWCLASNIVLCHVYVIVIISDLYFCPSISFCFYLDSSSSEVYSSPYFPYLAVSVLEIPAGRPVWGRQLWRRTGKHLLIFLQFYVYDLRSKAWGPTTFWTEFQTLHSCSRNSF